MEVTVPEGLFSSSFGIRRLNIRRFFFIRLTVLIELHHAEDDTFSLPLVYCSF